MLGRDSSFQSHKARLKAEAELSTWFVHQAFQSHKARLKAQTIDVSRLRFLAFNPTKLD